LDKKSPPVPDQRAFNDQKKRFSFSLVPVGEITLSLDSRCASLPGCCDSLTIDVIRNISGRENARSLGAGAPGILNDVAVLIDID